MNTWGPEVAHLVRWDWYQGTVFGGAPGVVIDQVARGYGDLVTIEPATPRNGYLRGCQLMRGEQLVEVWYEGNPGTHFKASGSRSPEFARIVRTVVDDWRWEFSPSRVDACIDWIEPGLFDELAHLALAFAVERGIKINQQGDWQRGQARSLYLGARESVVQLVIYEKGYEAGGDVNWVRFEVRVRPKGEARLEVGRWAPSMALAACAWLADLVEALGLGARIAQAVGTVWRPSDAARARRALVKQYGGILGAWAQEAGSWAAVGVELGCAVAAVPVVHSREAPSAGPSEDPEREGSCAPTGAAVVEV